MSKQNSLVWLDFAIKDLQVAQELLKFQDKYVGIVAYHAQQAAEKSLHAYLIFRENSAPKTHDLPYLVKQCSFFDSDFVVFTDRAKALDPFSIQTRYPNHFEYELSHGQATELVDYAYKIVEFVRERMK